MKVIQQSGISVQKEQISASPDAQRNHCLRPETYPSRCLTLEVANCKLNSYEGGKPKRYVEEMIPHRKSDNALIRHLLLVAAIMYEAGAHASLCVF